MHCEDCGTETKGDDLMCASCGGRLTQDEIDLPEVAPFPIKALERSRLGPAVSAEEAGPRLEVRVGNLTGAIAANKPVVSIGRHEPGGKVRPDVDLSADDAVSRRHAELRLREGGVYLVDLGSTNGTLVNGEALAAGEERTLAEGDVIQLGERCVLTARL